MFHLKGVLDSPVLTYKNTLSEILVSWSPVGSDTVCGPVTYNITVMPSHGMMMMINDTAYNITGLYYNTNYTITVYATNNVRDGESAIVTVKTSPGSNVIYVTLKHACLQYKSGTIYIHKCSTQDVCKCKYRQLTVSQQMTSVFL